METKFTKGPWLFSQDEVCDSQGNTIASLLQSPSQYFKPRKENLSNARLIAAAPDMIKALIEIYEDDSINEMLNDSQLKAIESLIRKATSAK